jgi:hypothetical protein
VTRHEFQGQQAAFDIDLFEAFGDFGTEISNTDLSLLLAPKADPILHTSISIRDTTIEESDLRSFRH